MNIENFKLSLGRTFGKANLTLQKYSPEILLGFGIVGGVVAAVMASKATLKAEEIADKMLVDMEQVERVHDHKAMTGANIDYTDQDYMKDKLIVYTQTGLKFAKLYGPAVGLGVLSIAAILASHGVMANRQVSLVAAYNLVVNGFQAYRDRVVKEFGVDKDSMFALGLREEEYKEEVIDEDGKTKKVKKTRLVVSGDPKMYQRMFDSSNPNWKHDALLNTAWLEGQERWLNDKLTINGYLFLNEVLTDLGFKAVPEGQLVGWVLRSPEEMKTERRDGYVSLGLHSQFNQSGGSEDGGILLDPNVDGVIYTLI